MKALREIRVQGGERAAAQARSEIAEHLAEHLGEDRLHDLRLIVSELVSNSVRHGGVDGAGWISLSVWEADDRVRVELRDSGRQGEPRRRPPDLSAGGGFGLLIVEQLALSWGIDHNPGLQVWFELARH